MQAPQVNEELITRGISMIAEVIGDLHTKGYLCEAVYKAQKSGAFMYIVNKVMKSM